MSHTTRPDRPTVVRSTAVKEFSALGREIKDRGLLRRRYTSYWAKLIAWPLALATCIMVFILIGDTWWQLLTAVVFALVFTQIAFLGHDAAHRQIFASGRWNVWISLILGNLFVGMSYGWWQHKHTRHHANPNKLGADPDLELPIITVAPTSANEKKNRLLSWVRSHQGAFFFPLLLLEGLSLHASGIRRVLAKDTLDHRWVEIVFLAVRLGGFTGLVFFILSPGIAAVFLAVQLAIFGFYLGATFALNHKGMPIVPKDKTFDFLRRQVIMSRNIRGSRVLDFAMGGLNYQIEHHLFPNMPRTQLRKAAPLVAEFCRERGIPYTKVGVWRSYALVTRYINRVGLGERDAFTCPLLDQRMQSQHPA